MKQQKTTDDLEEKAMYSKKMKTAFLALGMAAALFFSGCSFTGEEGTKKAETTAAAVSPTAAVTATPTAETAQKPTNAPGAAGQDGSAQSGSGQGSGGQNSGGQPSGNQSSGSQSSGTSSSGSTSSGNQNSGGQSSGGDQSSGSSGTQGGSSSENQGGGSQETRETSGNVRSMSGDVITLEIPSGDGTYQYLDFDVSYADADIDNGSSIRSGLNVDIKYYTQDGVNIVTNLYSDGEEYMSQSVIDEQEAMHGSGDSADSGDYEGESGDIVEEYEKE